MKHFISIPYVSRSFFFAVAQMCFLDRFWTKTTYISEEPRTSLLTDIGKTA